ncbi:hypothetical protein HMPREF3216_01090 [Gardnerella vaginalis]|uniref:Uncharacterized protein n=1 Tax=Gardnerella vaginalis TaxID=2702 RepID=A0A133NMM4_GARVA|nr:hypothetical protein HMPREF3216_01090 [Gardnerella vaginalis]
MPLCRDDSGTNAEKSFAHYALSAQAGRRAHVCFFFPAFVYVLADFGNKHGQKGTNTGK